MTTPLWLVIVLSVATLVAIAKPSFSGAWLRRWPPPYQSPLIEHPRLHAPGWRPN